MGAWGTGIFDNDTASDWAFGLERENDLSAIETALDTVIASGEGYLEAPEAEEALAAADAIARLQGRWGIRDSYTEPVDKWVERVGITPSAAVVDKAVAAIDRIVAGPSEIVELWRESDDFRSWQQSVEELKSRVRS